MAASTRRDLFLQVSASTSNLEAAMKAGRSVLNEFGTDAVATTEQVQRAFANLGGGSIEQSARSIEASYNRTFNKIRENARSVLDAPGGGGAAAVQILNANAGRQAAAAAEAQAAGLRMVADAAARAAKGTGEGATAARVYATAAEAAAVGAERQAIEMRSQAQVLDSIEGELRAVAGAQQGLEQQQIASTGSAGQQKAALQQLSFQLNDISTQFATGTPIMTIFAQQSGQVFQALGMLAAGGGTAQAAIQSTAEASDDAGVDVGGLGETIVGVSEKVENGTGRFGAFAAFMAGPWGAAVVAAVSILTPFVFKMLENNDALEEAVDKMKADAAATDVSRRAREAFTATIEGQIDAQRTLNEELKRGQQTQAQIEQSNLNDSRRRFAAMMGEDARLRKEIEAARVAGIRAREMAIAPNAASIDGQGQLGLLAAAAAAEDKWRTLVDQYNANATTMNETRRGIRDAETVILERDVAASLDAGTAATLKYEKALGRLRDQRRSGALSAADFRAQLAKEQQIRDAAIKAAQDRKTATPSLGDQLDTERGQRLLVAAQRFTGTSEKTTAGRASLMGLFSQAGISVDPKMTAWCAAFVNAVLATNGLPGTGSLAARSFLTYGEKTDKPEKGDIVVMKRDGGGAGAGHVGFFAGTGKDGRIMVTSGNYGDKVTTSSFDRRDVLGFRRAPSAANAEAAAEKAARAAEEAERKRIGDAAAYAELLARAQQEQIDATRKRTVDIAAAAQLDRDAVALERQRRDAAAQVGADKGRWTQGEADAIKAVNRVNADQQMQAIRSKESMALLDRQLEQERDQLSRATALLDLQGDLATTNAQRKRIALELLEREEAELRARAVALIGSDDPADWARGEAMLRQIEDERPYRERQVEQRFAGPRDQYRAGLVASVGDMGDALEGVEARGLRGVEDGLVSIIDGTETAAGAFKKMATSILADLARIAVQRLILSVIGGPGFASGGRIEGFASGGRISGPGTGTSDSILALVGGRKPVMLSNGESIVNAAATSRYWPVIDAMNRGELPGLATGGFIEPRRIYQRRLPSAQSVARAAAAPPALVVDMRGCVTTAEFMSQMNSLMAQHAQVSILAGSQMAQQDIAEENARMIPS